MGSGGGGTVLDATSTTPMVTVDLDVTQEYLVKPGDAVTVVLPDGTTVGGRVETVGNVAVCPGGSGSGTGNGLTPKLGRPVAVRVERERQLLHADGDHDRQPGPHPARRPPWIRPR